MRVRAAVAAVATAGAMGVAAAPAPAVIFDFHGRTVADVFNGNSSAHIWWEVSPGNKKAWAAMNYGPQGVQARAKCKRANGGTQWYQSGIRVFTGGGTSHYDCDNNGTYNRDIVANGANIF